MGHIDSARVDIAALLEAAHRYDWVAGLIDSAVHRCQTSLAFGAGCAGRDYGDGGDQVRHAVAATVGRLQSWAAANRDIASALRFSAGRYTDVDARAARRIG
ncbi:type VII secretion target [Mycobacterium sp. NPDC003323]